MEFVGSPGGGLIVPVRRQVGGEEAAMEMLAARRAAIAAAEAEAEKEKDWHSVTDRADALQLIERVKKQATPMIDRLKEIDAKGEGDVFPEAGKAAIVNSEDKVPGLGFNSGKTATTDAFLRFDTTSGEVQEFRQRTRSSDGETTEELAILKDGGATTYVSVKGTWREAATESADGTYTREKRLHITDEMAEMLKFQMAMKMAAGGGLGIE